MNATTRNIQGTTIVDIAGHIDLGSSPALRKTMLECLKSTERLAANLAEVKYIDSSGIASLLEVLKAARNSKKKFILFGLTVGVVEVMKLTRLTGVFEIYGTEQELLDSGTPA
jgi:anti-sigma B factor antagonist